jgi:hypothetical protein
MDITVSLPEPIVLENYSDAVKLIVGPGMDSVTIHGNGDIYIRGNGGGACAYKINVPELLRMTSLAILREQNET